MLSQATSARCSPSRCRPRSRRVAAAERASPWERLERFGVRAWCFAAHKCDNVLVTLVKDDTRLWIGFPGIRTLELQR